MSESKPIPQMDLAAQYTAIGGEIREAVTHVLASQQFVLGKEGAALEREIAGLCGVQHGIFADIDSETFNVHPDEISKRVTPRTRAILVVHLYGLAADIDPIRNTATRHGIPVIEDNAQAIGARYKGKPTGALGDMACVSFYPTKNLGAYGDAGMIVTNSEEIDARLRILRNHGQASRYSSVEPGWNSRLDEIQATILRVKLRYLGDWERARRTHAAHYSKLLASVREVKTPKTPEGYEHVFHQYTIRVPRRNELQKYLSDRMIGNAVYYPVPLHLQPIYASLGHGPGSFPEAERAANEVVSLPMFPELQAEQIERVAKAIAEFFAG